MRGWIRTVVLAGAIVLGLDFAATTLRAQDADATEVSRSLEHETFDLINAYRVREGMSKLVWDPVIAKMARLHSRDMATGAVGFGHGGFERRMETLHGMYANMRGGGENVFYTDVRPGVAAAAVNAWLHSPPHLHNIRGDYQLSGLGLWRRSDGAYFFTQIFVKLEAERPDVP